MVPLRFEPNNMLLRQDSLDFLDVLCMSLDGKLALT